MSQAAAPVPFVEAQREAALPVSGIAWLARFGDSLIVASGWPAAGWYIGSPAQPPRTAAATAVSSRRVT